MLVQEKTEVVNLELNRIINSLIHKNIRVRVFYGKTDGKAWVEEFDIMGYIGRSTGGDMAIPILLYNKKSIGGCGILVDSIVKLVETKSKKVLYQHPKFTMPDIQTHFCYVMVDNGIHANCTTNEKAIRLTKFLKGERNSK